jgi:hypothetical protein
MARFYGRHPWRAAMMVYRDLHENGGWRRPRNIGNYEREAGYPPETRTGSFGWWSALRSALFRVAPWHILLWYAAFLGMGIRVAWRNRGTEVWRIAVFGIVLAAMGIAELGLTALADAGETERHLFLFHVITDFTMLLALVWCLPARVTPAYGPAPEILARRGAAPAKARSSTRASS